MSSIRSIVEIASKKCLEDVGSLLESSLPRITGKVSNALANDNTVANHFSHLHDRLGIFVDGMQQQVVDKITRSATARCREYLLGDTARLACVRASLKDFNVKVDLSDQDREIDSLTATIHILENDVSERDQTINNLQVRILSLAK